LELNINNKIIIINQAQFGYHLDTYYYSKYLKESFEVSYICWDYGNKKIEFPNINIFYISRKGNIFTRNFRFIFETLKLIKKNNYNYHFIKYFRGCSILKVFSPTKKYLFDIRTGSVSHKKIKRIIYDFILKFESFFFPEITIISDSLRKKMNISSKKVSILPLGADVISNKLKKFDEMNLIYVGTLNGRKLEDTIHGLYNFFCEFNKKINITYRIIGNGDYSVLEKLKKIIIDYKLEKIIEFTGYVHHQDLGQYFDESNIGVSYIPITDYYDVQPPTKTFEYLLSGMIVIATSTKENLKIISENNGVLINDNSNSFYEGLVSIYNRIDGFNSNIIKEQSKKYHWKQIVSDFKNKILVK